MRASSKLSNLSTSFNLYFSTNTLLLLLSLMFVSLLDTTSHKLAKRGRYDNKNEQQQQQRQQQTTSKDDPSAYYELHNLCGTCWVSIYENDPNLTLIVVTTTTIKPRPIQRRSASLSRSLEPSLFMTKRPRIEYNQGISGGWNAKEGQAPSFLFLNGLIKCGAVLLSDRIALTSLFCFMDKKQFKSGNTSIIDYYNLVYPLHGTNEISKLFDQQESDNTIIKLCHPADYYSNSAVVNSRSYVLIKFKYPLFDGNITSKIPYTRPACLASEKKSVEPNDHLYVANINAKDKNLKLISARRFSPNNLDSDALGPHLFFILPSNGIKAHACGEFIFGTPILTYVNQRQIVVGIIVGFTKTCDGYLNEDRFLLSYYFPAKAPEIKQVFEEC